MEVIRLIFMSPKGASEATRIASSNFWGAGRKQCFQNACLHENEASDDKKYLQVLKGKSAYCLCASIAARFYDVSRNVSTMTSQRLGTAVIFPAILVLLRRSNFIGVRFIKIVWVNQANPWHRIHVLNTIIFFKKVILKMFQFFKFVIFFRIKTSHIDLHVYRFWNFFLQFSAFFVI